jgi:hypothetical protein
MASGDDLHAKIPPAAVSEIGKLFDDDTDVLSRNLRHPALREPGVLRSVTRCAKTKDLTAMRRIGHQAEHRLDVLARTASHCASLKVRMRSLRNERSEGQVAEKKSEIAALHARVR